MTDIDFPADSSTKKMGHCSRFNGEMIIMQEN